MSKCRNSGNHIFAGLLLLVLGAALPASASLVYTTEVNLGGTGLGSVLTVLTLQNNPTEMGCVQYTSGGDVLGGGCPGSFTGGDEKTQSQTRAISELTGMTSASQLGIIFNGNEPGSANPITLDLLVLTFYKPDGTAIASYNYTGPTTFTGDNGGTGGSGYVFQLDYDQATAAQLLLVNSGASFGTIRIGVGAKVSDSSGSNETFFISLRDPLPVPEPATFLTMGAGLIGLALYLRRRRATN